MFLFAERLDDPFSYHCLVFRLDFGKVWTRGSQREEPGMFEKSVKRGTFARDFI